MKLREPMRNIRLRLSIPHRLEPHRPVAFYTDVYYGNDKVVTASIPHPDLFSPDSAIAATIHRYACDMPPIEPGTSEHFMTFARAFIKRFIPKVHRLKTRQEWLRDARYTVSRKIELDRISSDITLIQVRDMICKSFIKDEDYPSSIMEDFKCMRAINSYTDITKAFIGPWASSIEEVLYKLPWFVKHGDVRDRPRVLHKAFRNRRVKVTDYKSCEAHHHDCYNDLGIEWKTHMLEGIDGFEQYIELEEELCCGFNRIRFKELLVEVWQRLMSGKMTTSDDNCVFNLIVTFYLICQSNYGELALADQLEKCLLHNVFIEGDDGEFDDVYIDPDLIVRMGLKLKMEVVENCGLASFCGIVCDLETYDNVTEPLHILVGFFKLPLKWMRSKRVKHLALFRAKALSYLYQYGGCPIIAPLCHYVLRCTKSIDPRWTIDQFGWYEKPILSKALSVHWFDLIRPIYHSTRVLVEKVYNIPISKQLEIEDHFCRSTHLHPYSFDIDLNPSWTHFADKYVGKSEGTLMAKPFYPEFFKRLRTRGRYRGPDYGDVPAEPVEVARQIVPMAPYR